MAGRRRRVVILGGGMAGLAAAWRLSEPGWTDDLESITVYQRGWRLGGKGASGRGVHGRIEEHGLHIWLGYYENAFRLLRECYAELDRPRTDPTAPIRTWRDALFPAPVVGLEESHGGTWSHWIGQFAPNNEVPGEPDAPGGPMSVIDFVRRAVKLLGDFAGSISPGRGGIVLSTSSTPPRRPPDGVAGALAVAAAATALEALSITGRRSVVGDAQRAIDSALDEVGATLAAIAGDDERVRRSWHLLSVVLATVRGILADGLLTDPRGFRAINDEDYRAWIGRHGAAPEALESTLVSGLYDLVFAHVDGDPARGAFGAGWGVFLSGKTFFDYKGAIFWKMSAGMGDVVFAPLYEALRRRGVGFEFFRRVDHLRLSSDRAAVDTVTIGVQARLAPGHDRYEPLSTVNCLPCFPSAPLVEQLEVPPGVDPLGFDTHWSERGDAGTETLRRGEDFDDIVLAIPVGMAPLICQELIDDSPAWQAMVGNLGTVATQALQLWLEIDEPSLGWAWPGGTVSGYVKPFDTFASMPQLIAAEDWPPEASPRTIAYFCSTMPAPWPVDECGSGYAKRHRELVRANAQRFIEHHLVHLLPGVAPGGSVRWELLCGADDDAGPEALDSQFFVANVDPSDRYVQSLPGTDGFRLRPDDSGYDNLVLAGDWTDCGLNAGCIEAAVLSGLQAANAVLGRSRSYRIAGAYLI